MTEALPGAGRRFPCGRRETQRGIRRHEQLWMAYHHGLLVFCGSPLLLRAKRGRQGPSWRASWRRDVVAS